MNMHLSGNLAFNVFNSREILARRLAHRICQLVEDRREHGSRFVLCLAAGSSPMALYMELVRRHVENGFSFSSCTLFSLDEYYPMLCTSRNSFYRSLHGIAGQLDVPKEHITLVRGDMDRADVEKYCEDYEASVAQAGGIDFLILGIGRNGHIGFNEPGTGPRERTRLVKLNDDTRFDAAGSFGGIENVPSEAITMGTATILGAREIAMIVTGRKKSPILKQLLECSVTSDIPASYLKDHASVTVYADIDAAPGQLTKRSS